MQPWDASRRVAPAESLSRIEVQAEGSSSLEGPDGGGQLDRVESSEEDDGGRAGRGLAVWDRPSMRTSRLLAEPLAIAAALRPTLERPSLPGREEPSGTEPVLPEVGTPEPVAVPISAPDDESRTSVLVEPAAEESSVDPAELAADLPEVQEPTTIRQAPPVDQLAGVRDVGRSVLERSGGDAAGPGPSVRMTPVPLRPALPSLSGLRSSEEGDGGSVLPGIPECGPSCRDLGCRMAAVGSGGRGAGRYGVFAIADAVADAGDAGHE